MAKDKKLAQKIKELSCDITPYLKEYLLFQLKFGINLLTVPHTPTSSGVWKVYYQTFDEMERDAGEGDGLEFDKDQLIRSLQNLKRRGLVEFIKDKAYIQPKITREGEKILKEVLPTYREKRTWDKKFYMVTYDIPESKRGEREMLRKFLIRLGAGQLQKSVYFTPYNPGKVLEAFLREKKLAAQVIISSFGVSGGVVGWSFEELLAEIFDLSAVNGRYRDFVKNWHRRRSFAEAEKSQIAFEFNSILLQDPQLPFELLPKNWFGEKAYAIYKQALRI